MHSSFAATLLAVSAVFSTALAGPLYTRQVCGAAPGGNVAQTPLSQPAGITTAADCATQCKGNPSCLSFLFGLVNSVDKCMLFSVAAASIPPQTNMVAYDIGCSSIPSVVPTAANPGGLANGGGAAKGGPQGNQRQRRQQQGGNGGAQGSATGNNNGGTTQNGANNGGTNNGGATANQGTHANPMNAIPAGNPNPISTPAVTSLAACLAACQGNPACVAYTFTSNTCKLF